MLEFNTPRRHSHRIYSSSRRADRHRQVRDQKDLRLDVGVRGSGERGVRRWTTHRPLRGRANLSVPCPRPCRAAKVERWQVLGSNQRRLSRRFYSWFRCCGHAARPPADSARSPWSEAEWPSSHGQPRITLATPAQWPGVGPRLRGSERVSLATAPACDSGPAAILSYRAMAAGGLASALGKEDSARRGTGMEEENAEGPHRARSLARRVYQWAKRRP